MIDFLLNPQYVVYAGWVLAFLTPFAAAVVLIFWRRQPPFLTNGVFWTLAASGPLLLVLWFVFNLIEDLLGLGSILALAVNLVLFCLLGLLLGAVLMIARKKGIPPQDQGGPDGT